MKLPDDIEFRCPRCDQIIRLPVRHKWLSTTVVELSTPVTATIEQHIATCHLDVHLGDMIGTA